MKKRNLYHISFFILLSLLAFSACDDKEVTVPETASVELWDEISSLPEYATFVEAVEYLGLDSLFGSGEDYTIFIPNNTALENFDYITNPLAASILKYHIINFPLLINTMPESRNILTVSGKYALLNKTASGYAYSGVEVGNGSPMFQHGRYYELSALASPAPTIAEYLSISSPSLYTYITSQDSTFLDMDKSEYIGNDPETGVPIYDEVYTTVNTFYENVFNIEETTRNDFATIMMFSEEQFAEAKQQMAIYLGLETVPEDWLNSVFFPDYISTAVLYGAVNFEDFTGITRLRNTLGEYLLFDTDDVDDASKQICSNGFTYMSNEFEFDLQKYVADIILTAEDFATDEAGLSFWNENVTTSHSETIKPTISSGNLSVDLSDVEASDNYWIEITVPYTFPGEHFRLEIESKIDQTCRLSVFVNDKILTNEATFFLSYPDNTPEIFDMKYLEKTNRSVNHAVSGESFEAANSINRFDYWVKDTAGNDLITSYGDLRIRFEYKGASVGSINGDGFNFNSIKLIKED